MTKQTIISIIILILAIAGLVFLTFWKPKNQAPLIPDNTNQQSGELISIQPTMVDVSEDSFLLGIGGSYPQFSQADALFNENLANIFNEEIKNFKEMANNDYAARLEMDGASFEKEFAENGSPYSYDIKTHIVQSNEKYISFVARLSGYTGGAHGYQYVVTFNYDVTNKKILSITDFKTLEQVSDQSRTLLKQQFQEKEVWDNSMQEWINEGTDPAKVENFNAFTFTDKILTVYFGQYQVAPYVFGESEVEIVR